MKSSRPRRVEFGREPRSDQRTDAQILRRTKQPRRDDPCNFRYVLRADINRLARRACGRQSGRSVCSISLRPAIGEYVHQAKAATAQGLKCGRNQRCSGPAVRVVVPNTRRAVMAQTPDDVQMIQSTTEIRQNARKPLTPRRPLLFFAEQKRKLSAWIRNPQTTSRS